MPRRQRNLVKQIGTAFSEEAIAVAEVGETNPSIIVSRGPSRRRVRLYYGRSVR